MAKLINCECGYTVRGETDDEVVAAAAGHLAENHPDIAGTVTREEFLAMAEEEPAS